MKKIIVLLLVMILTLSAAACGGSKAPADNTASQSNGSSAVESKSDSADASSGDTGTATKNTQDFTSLVESTLTVSDYNKEVSKLENGQKVVYSKKAEIGKPNFDVTIDGYHFTMPVKYTDLIGLNADELETVALIVRLYPEQNPYENFYYENLPPHKKVLVSKLTAILRIADALDASHKQKTKKMTIVLNPDSLHISCQSDVDMSFEAWSFEHRSGLFEEVIGIRPELRTRRTL